MRAVPALAALGVSSMNSRSWGRRLGPGPGQAYPPGTSHRFLCPSLYPRPAMRKSIGSPFIGCAPHTVDAFYKWGEEYGRRWAAHLPPAPRHPL